MNVSIQKEKPVIFGVLTTNNLNQALKFFVAISITPLIYLAHYLIDMYLGKELSIKAKESALEN